MKIKFSWHVLNEKIPLLKKLNWNITKTKIRQTIKNPVWRGVTEDGQPTAMSLVNKNYILRVIYKHEDGIIKVITIHIARRGRYESTTEN